MLRPIGSQRDLGVSACNVLLSAQEAYRVVRQAIDCRIKKLLIYPVLLVNIEKQVQENTVADNFKNRNFKINGFYNGVDHPTGQSLERKGCFSGQKRL